MNTKEFILTIVSATALLLLLGIFLIIFLKYILQKKREFFTEKQSIVNSFQQTLLQSQLEIQEQTFKNISQEIHDNIGQALTLAKLNLNTMPAAPGQEEKISTTKDIISKAITDLRDLGRSLNTDYIVDMGLQKALEYELGIISKSAAITTTIQAEGEPVAIDKQKELILFRIIQEVLNNILKHADARNISAKISYQPDHLELLVEDDGKGFEPGEHQPENGSGLGLRNMHNRAKLIGAAFSVKSIPGKGTRVQVNLPINGTMSPRNDDNT